MTVDTDAARAGAAFREPPLDYTRQISQLYDWHLASPDFTFIRYPETGADGKERVVDWTYERVSIAIHAFARKVAKHLGTDLDKGEVVRAGKLGTDGRLSAPVVAIFANGPPMTYLPMSLAIIRAGAVPFPISINNSKEALVSLLKRSGATMLIPNPAGAGQMYDDVLATALQEMDEKLDEIAYPSFDDFFLSSSATDARSLIQTPLKLQPWDSTAYILHSSGSTNHPKPIYHTQRYVVNATREFKNSGESFVGHSLFSGHLPPWHTMAFIFPAACWVMSGISLQFRPYSFPPKSSYSLTDGCFLHATQHSSQQQPLTPGDLLAELDQSPPGLIALPPTFWDMYSRDPKAVETFRQVPWRASGGGPISLETLQRLHTAGVTVLNGYGSTEAAMLTSTRFASAPLPFDRLDCFVPTTKCPLYYRDQGDGTYEMLVGSNDSFRPNVINDTYEGKEVYATSDLFELVDGGKLLRIVGRIDDQLMHSTGEKTNPGPLIAIIQENASVKSCCFFGRGRPFAGLLVEPADTDFEPRNDEELAAFRNAIWPDVQRANAMAPTHSTIFKEMIVVAKKSKPFERTPKNTLRIAFIVKNYAPEIDEAYAAFEDSAQTRIAAPREWTPDSTLAYVRTVVDEALEGALAASREADPLAIDLFSVGADSLRAAKIRNVLATSTKKRLDPMFVYAYPTVRTLADALLAVVEAADGDETAAAGAKSDAAQAMLDKYSTNWPKKAANGHGINGKAVNGIANDHTADVVVLVTGTTGGLGACLVSDLVKSSRVRKVYAVNRRGKQDLRTRQVDSFQERGLDGRLLDEGGKVQLVEADLEKLSLGLEQSLYEEMRDSVSVIVHNAWRLDFNLSLASFEPLIKGTRNLIDMALTSHASHEPRFLFSSSISAVLGVPDDVVLEDEFPLSAAGNQLGYGMGKMVTEHLLLASPLAQTTSIRFGQLSGTLGYGYWSTTDWLPLLVKSYEVVGALPLAGPNDAVSWIAMDVAARTYADVALAQRETGAINGANDGGETTLHVVNPSLALWNDIVPHLAAALGTKTVPYAEWLARVEAASRTHSLDAFPTAKLLRFFSVGSAALSGGKHLDTRRAQARSPALYKSKAVDGQQAREWVAYWRRTGFLAGAQ